MNVRKWQRGLTGLFLLVALVITPQMAVAGQADDDYLPGQMVVKLRDGAAISTVSARYGAAAIGQMSNGNTFLLRLPAGLSTNQALQQMRSDPDLIGSEPNHTFWIPEAQQFSINVSGQTVVPAGGVHQSYLDQWAVTKTGLAQALRRTRGANIVVAVLDTGVDRTHPALAGKVIAGWDFVDGDDDPSDVPNGRAAGHGTLLSGIVALAAPDAKIMPVRVLDSDGRGTLFNLTQSLVYAAERGAQVINLSLGATHDTSMLRDAVAYAAARGSVVVAAAGNHTTNDRGATILYPARYKESVAVAATDRDDLKTSFSNWGTWTDLSAPGMSVYSTYPGGRYAWFSGTSAASAFVSGGAALVRSAYPTWNHGLVVQRLEETAASIDALNSPELRGKLGAGRIDLDAATQPRNR